MSARNSTILIKYSRITHNIDPINFNTKVRHLGTTIKVQPRIIKTSTVGIISMLAIKLTTEKVPKLPTVIGKVDIIAANDTINDSSKDSGTKKSNLLSKGTIQINPIVEANDN
jgi:hypothetical protein